MRIILGYGFREMGLHRIQLGVAPFNPAGIRAYEKAGFVEEGRLRESVLHDGRWYDEVLMSVLDHEWAARRSPDRWQPARGREAIRGHSCGQARVVPAAGSGDAGASRMTQEGTHDGWNPDLEGLPDRHGRRPGIGGKRQA